MLQGRKAILSLVFRVLALKEVIIGILSVSLALRLNAG